MIIGNVGIRLIKYIAYIALLEKKKQHTMFHLLKQKHYFYILL